MSGRFACRPLNEIAADIAASWKMPSVAYQIADKYAKKGWTIDSGEESEDGFTVHFGVIR